LHIIEQLFPAHKGLTFLNALLRHAQVKQLALPHLGLSEIGEVAVIQIHSIRELSKKIGWGYDTTNKYMMLFCQLQLLYKHRLRTHSCLYVPLSRVRLPSPGVLDQLQKCRPKVAQFAGGVKRRFQLICKQVPSLAPRTPDTPTLDLFGILADIRQILSSKQVDDDQQQQLLTEIQAILRRRCSSPLLKEELLTPPDTTLSRLRYASSGGKEDSIKVQETLVSETQQQSSFFACQKDSRSQQREQKRRMLEQVGGSRPVPLQKSPCSLSHEDSVATSTVQPGRLLEQVRGLALPPAPNTGRLSVQKEDPLYDGQASQSPQPSKKGDLALGQVLQQIRLARHKEDAGPAAQPPTRRLPEKKGDYQHKGDVEMVSPNVNVITIFESITSNVTIPALFCCKVFQEPVARQGVYAKIFRDDCQHDVQAVTAAFIYVIAHRGDGSITKPAALFLARCRQWHQHGIPEEAAALVKQYGHLSYPRFIEALRAPTCPDTSSTSLPPQTAAPFEPLIPLRSTGGMSREEALQVYHQIRRDLRLSVCRKQLVLLADCTTYAVLIDNTITDRIHQVAIYSSQEWQKRSATLRRCFDIFRDEV
jgi:hypothetical protein